MQWHSSSGVVETSGFTPAYTAVSDYLNSISHIETIDHDQLCSCPVFVVDSHELIFI